MNRMNNEVMIRPIRLEEAAEAARLNITVAYELMKPQISLEVYTAAWKTRGVLVDLEDVQKNYFENGGVFLVVVGGGKMIGTGAFQRYAEGECILRRIALLPDYRGQRLGYALMMELLQRARAMGYGKMCLWTDRHKTTRAVSLYHRLGFVDVPHEGAYENELWMEMVISSAD